MFNVTADMCVCEREGEIFGRKNINRDRNACVC